VTVGVARLTKIYPGSRRHPAPIKAVDAVDLEVRDGELLVIVGPSGSGKTTLLRCVAGLETPDAGAVTIGGRDVTEMRPGDRDIAMVFQEYALYPHLSAARNITLGLEARKVPVDDIRRRLAEVAELLGLTDALERLPSELSGGERQRVALARAIVRQPTAFLMDEPLSNLDAALRTQTRSDIRALQRSLATSTLYVTHDQVEAMTMGDRVAVLRNGSLEQLAEPNALYAAPATGFVARFLGSPPMSVVPAGVLGLRAGNGGVAGVRPEELRIVSSGGRFSGDVVAIERLGGHSVVHVRASGSLVLVRLDRGAAPAAEGERVEVDFDDGSVHRFESPDGARTG
jgi:multiple sugar transport system ATP-binding protein